MTAGTILDPRDAEIERLRGALAEANAALNREIDSRRRSEETQRVGDLSSRAAIDGIPGFVAILAPDGAVEVVNRQIAAYCGRPLEDLRRWSLVGIVHDEDLPRVITLFSEATATGTPYDYELRLRRFDGVYRWFSNRGVPVKDDAGNVLCWYVLLTDIDDRKRAEQALAASERDLKQTIDTIPAVVFCNNAEGPNEFLSRCWHDYTGISTEAALGTGWQASLHPDDLPGMMKSWMAMLKTGEGGEIEGRMRRVDGVYRWFLFRSAPLRDPAGKIVKWYGTVTDIEDRKQAEHELRRAHDSFADAQRLSHTGSFVTDLRGDDHHWSEEAYRIFGFQPGSTVTAERIRAIVHPDDLVLFDHVIERGLQGFEADVVFRILPAGGALKYIRGVGHVVEEVVGYPKFIGALQDVTETRLAEDALRRSEAFLAQGEAVSATGSFLWKLSTGEIRWSDQLYRIFGLAPGSVVTLEGIGARVHREDAPMMVDMQRRAHAGLDSEYEHRLLMPDGSVKYLHFVAHSIRGIDGQLEYMGVVQDITDRKLAEQAHDKVRSELAHAARVMSLGVLTASLAHEVNQPLAGIITNANTGLRMLSADPPNVKGALETARRTIRDGNRASEVVTRLRTLFSKKEFATETVDLNDATREVIALSAHELQRHHIAILTEYASSALEVVGDRVQIQQVILNLLLNACDAVKSVENGPRIIVVQTADDGEGAGRITVRDTGVGIAPESLARLFDPFYTTKVDGMGIGLSVSRSIIDRHQGRLWAAANDGPGATFAFSVPINPPK